MVIPTPRKLPILQTTLQALLRHPRQSLQFIEERQTLQFRDRAHIGEHRRAFQELTGLPVSNVSALISEFGLQTRPTALREERENAHKAAVARRVYRDQAARAHINGTRVTTDPSIKRLAQRMLAKRKAK